jgi:hypothetical protein
VESVEKSLGFRADFHIAFADFESSRYHAFFELDGAGKPSGVSIASALDKALGDLNMEYKAKRQSNRLRPLALHELRPASFITYKQQALEAGAREGQFKLTQLSIDDDRFRFFKSLKKTRYEGDRA